MIFTISISMTNKHKTGNYLIYLYDKYGTKQDTVPADSFTLAEAAGDKAISIEPYASYVIVRVIKNSLDNANPWSRNVQSSQGEIEEMLSPSEREILESYIKT